MLYQSPGHSLDHSFSPSFLCSYCPSIIFSLSTPSLIHLSTQLLTPQTAFHCGICWFLHSCCHLLTYSLIQSLKHFRVFIFAAYCHSITRAHITWIIYSHIHLCMHPFIQFSIHAIADSLIQTVIQSFLHSLVQSSVHTLMRLTIHSFIDSFIRSFVRSYCHLCTDSFIRLFLHSCFHSFVLELSTGGFS